MLCLRKLYSEWIKAIISCTVNMYPACTCKLTLNSYPHMHMYTEFNQPRRSIIPWCVLESRLKVATILLAEKPKTLLAELHVYNGHMLHVRCCLHYFIIRIDLDKKINKHISLPNQKSWELVQISSLYTCKCTKYKMCIIIVLVNTSTCACDNVRLCGLISPLCVCGESPMTACVVRYR